MLDPELEPSFAESERSEWEPADRRFPWRYAIALGAASVAGCVLVVPFTQALLMQMKNQPQIVLDMMPLVMTIQVLIESALSIMMIALGLGLGWSLGVVWPPLDGWGAGAEGAKRMRAALSLSAGMGIVLGLLFVVQAHVMDTGGKGNVDIKLPSSWSCLLASVGAGIREEVWLRLGLMTFFAWAITRLARRTAPASGAVWVANVAASLVFGAIHLPQAFAFLNTSASLIIFVLIGNGVPGVVFGWLFWRKGLIAAMLSHTFFDIVTKVVYPLFIG